MMWLLNTRPLLYLFFNRNYLSNTHIFQFELKELQRRQEEDDRKHRGGGRGGALSPTRIETTFPAEGGRGHETHASAEGRGTCRGMNDSAFVRQHIRCGTRLKKTFTS